MGSFCTTLGVVENLLELGGGSAALVRRQISLATQIDGVRDCPPPEFVGRSRDERFECLAGAAALESSGRADRGQEIELHNRVFRVALGQVGGQPRGLSGVTRQTQRDRGFAFNILAGRESQRRLRPAALPGSCCPPAPHAMQLPPRSLPPSLSSSARWAESDARRVSSRALANCPP